MLIHTTLCSKFDFRPFMEISAGQHYFFLLIRSSVRCTKPDWPPYEGSCVIVFLRPGDFVKVERLDEYFLYDLLEFSPDDTLLHLIQTLALPVVPHTPNYFYHSLSVLKTIHHTFYSADKYRMQKINAHIQLILYGMADGNEELEGNTSERLLHHRLRRIRVLISDDPAKDWTVEDAANFVGLSESRFSVVYKKYFGTSFISDVIRCRIQSSCSMLESTDKSVAEIARDSGYDSEQFFHRQFKQQTGLTPGEYRKLNSRSV